jgi:hydroxymethylglutaryl-CoA reductase
MGKVNKLAEIIGGAVLADEISPAGAIASDDWAPSHEKFGRNRRSATASKPKQS